MSTSYKANRFSKSITALLFLMVTVFYGCNNSSTSTDTKMSTDSTSSMSAGDSMKMSADSTAGRKMKMDSSTDTSGKGNQPLPGQPTGTGH